MGTMRAGLLGGLYGGLVIWVYEAIVWVGLQHQMPLLGISANATGLLFGKSAQASLGIFAHVIGIAVHFAFSLAWGVLFAQVWPWFRRRGYEATYVALYYAVFAWTVMHAAIAAVSDSHPNYLDPVVVIGGFMSHFFFAVPLALYVKKQLAAES
jgi:hypothetical protein